MTTLQAPAETLKSSAWLNERAVRGTIQAAYRLGLRRESVLIETIAVYARRYPRRWPHPSQELLAKHLGVTRETISRWLRRLEEAGLLFVARTVARPHGPTGELKRRTNRYLLLRRQIAIHACPLRRRKRRSHLRDEEITRPSFEGTEPPPGPSESDSRNPAPGGPTPEETPAARLIDLPAKLASLREARGWRSRAQRPRPRE